MSTSTTIIVAIFLAQLASIYKASLASFSTNNFQAVEEEVLENCPSKCECQRIGKGIIISENITNNEEEENYLQFSGLSIRCLRGLMNDSEFLSLLQNVPIEVEQLEIRGAIGKPNNLHWHFLSDNLNRLSRLRHLSLIDCSIPALSQSIRLPLLSKLYLMGNKLEQIQLGSFIGIPMLEMLDLSNNKISSLSTGAFIYLKNLRSLRLSHNRLGGPELSTANLLQGPKHLKELQLDGNKLNSKQINELLPDIPSLERLELNNCGLNDAEIWSLNLSAIPMLKRIGLASNNLTQVPSTSLRIELKASLSSLETLDLRENLIRTIGPCAFCGMNITKVYLGNNLLGLTNTKPFHREAFADTKITELDLGWNHFKLFDSSLLLGAQSTIEILHLSGNQLKINDNLIKTLLRLKELHLADCSLNNIPYSLSKSYQKLILLNISSNGLDHLPPNLDTLLPQLKNKLNLNFKLPHLLINFINNLNFAYFHHNPWDCECAAQSLQLYMLQKISFQELLRFDETLCELPEFLKGQPLHKVQKINDCAVLFGNNFGITQNTELILILSTLLISAFFLSLILIFLLYWGRDSKQKGSYLTREKNETTSTLKLEINKLNELSPKDKTSSLLTITQSLSKNQISLPQPLPPTNLLKISSLIQQQQQQPLLIQNTLYKKDDLSEQNNNYYSDCTAPKKHFEEENYKIVGKRINQEEERRTISRIKYLVPIYLIYIKLIKIHPPFQARSN
ncbi:LRRCT domain-containing protein [Meloidogyne graminicola]|uniref:LRRCT domain-containing protein n=1 Tax=Meloidogyne graminicola TaxID=189291 RepID=A0A8S9ZVE9_9BILA|nr:LRRCT domain-containing protein [Meloidogyne graminicola]